MYDELKSNIICKCVGHLIVINIGLNTVILFFLLDYYYYDFGHFISSKFARSNEHNNNEW